MANLNKPERDILDLERSELLEQIEEWLELPVLILGFIWLVLLLIELIWGLNPLLEGIGLIIWGIFVIDFVIRFSLAPHKLAYLRSNWLTALSLILPALRIFRIAWLARLLSISRTTRGMRLIRVVSSLNRGFRSLRRTMSRRGFGYASLLTAIVTLVGAAGMYAFEGNPASVNGTAETPGFNSYSEALWWTAMIMTTLGSEFWPRTAEGRILSFLLSLYAFGVFGYVTASLATFFIGRDTESGEVEVAGKKSIEALRKEIAALRQELSSFREETES